MTGDGVVGDTKTDLFVRLMEQHVNPSTVLGPRLVCLPGPFLEEGVADLPIDMLLLEAVLIHEVYLAVEVHSTLRVEMNNLEEQANNAKAHELFWKPLSWLGAIRPTSANDAFDPSLWETFVSTTLGLEKFVSTTLGLET